MVRKLMVCSQTLEQNGGNWDCPRNWKDLAKKGSQELII